jgi:hypothetical protein
MAGRNLIESLYDVLLFEDSLVKAKIQESLSNCNSALSDLQRAEGNNIIIKFKVGVVIRIIKLRRMRWAGHVA